MDRETLIVVAKFINLVEKREETIRKLSTRITNVKWNWKDICKTSDKKYWEKDFYKLNDYGQAADITTNLEAGTRIISKEKIEEENMKYKMGLYSIVKRYASDNSLSIEVAVKAINIASGHLEQRYSITDYHKEIFIDMKEKESEEMLNKIKNGGK